MNEEVLIEDKSKREEMISRIDVLDKVKGLILLPNTEFASVEMVAKYYDVSISAIKHIIDRHRKELNSDGFDTRTKKSLANEVKSHHGTLVSLGQTGFKIIFSDGSEVLAPNRGLRIFPKRAILRVGMLLRDSDVAKEVRTQLLNIVDTAQEELPKEIVTKDIDEEKDAMMDYARAYMSGNIDSLSQSGAKLMAIKNKHINKLTNENKALQGDIEEWEPKELVRKIVNKLSDGYNHGFVWNKLYNDLHYRYNILVHGRKKPKNGSLLDTLNDNEKAKLVQVAVSKAIKEQVDISEVLSHKPKELELDLSK
ncbi:MAG: hypothetical protein K0R54_6124 [Clostridiaceae bacterium]|nr:hypothetical protein [Clostridiaceae bacterium]